MLSTAQHSPQSKARLNTKDKKVLIEAETRSSEVALIHELDKVVFCIGRALEA